MKSGLYGLASLNHAPLDPADEARLFGASPLIASQGLSAYAAGVRPGEVDTVEDASGRCLLLGRIVKERETAQHLGLPSMAPSARVALAALHRWDADAPTHLGGEWLFLRWQDRPRTLTLMASACARDDIYYAVRGNRVAFAPQLARLVGLDWIEDAFDQDALVRSMARGVLRDGIGDRTFLKDVNRLRPGRTVTIAKDRIAVTEPRPAPPPTLRAVQFAEAMEEVERLLLRIVDDSLSGHDTAAFMLSGGLDSSLLTALGIRADGPDKPSHLLCSAAPEGSGLADETGWAQDVADHFARPLVRVVPDPASDIYAPSSRTLAGTEQVVASPRHYLYEALEDAASQRGASVLFDGSYGEITVSNHGFDYSTPRRRAGKIARNLYNRLLARQGQHTRLDDFHVQPSRNVMLAGDALKSSPAPFAERTLRRSDPLGFELGHAKAARVPTGGTMPGLRIAMPFRDPRLLRLVAAFPADFPLYDGEPRAMIRSLLQNRVPDRIAQRQSKLPFSPTYTAMLRDHAAAARSRIPAQRDAGADEWLDLAWLDTALAQAASGARLTEDQTYRTQSTAMAAEFLRWWRNGR